MEKRYFAITDLEVRAQESTEGSGRLIGYASVYNADSHDLGGFVERVSPSAFIRSLDDAKAGQRVIHALFGHDQNQPLGSTRSGKLSLETDDHGLRFNLDTTRFTPAQLDAARDGDLAVSFGFAVRHDEWDFPEDGPAIRTLIDVDLFEISPVVNPAYPQTEAALRSMTEARSRFTAEAKAELEARNAPEPEPEAITFSPEFEAIREEVLRRHHANIMNSPEYRRLMSASDRPE